MAIAVGVWISNLDTKSNLFGQHNFDPLSCNSGLWFGCVMAIGWDYLLDQYQNL